MKIALFGCGHLGYSFAHALLRKSFCEAKDLLLLHRSAKRCEELQKTFACEVTTPPNPQIGECAVIVLMVRPQDFAAAVPFILPYLRPHQLLISVMAGIPLHLLAKHFPGHQLFVRAMPNLPVHINKGMIPYFCEASLPQETIRQAETIFAALGTSLRLPKEELMNPATAISGTGPGYIFYLVEQLIQGAEELGFTAEQAKLLVKETMLGAVELWYASGQPIRELREGVRTKGGTTDAAFQEFENGKLAEILIRGMHAANLRAAAMAKQLVNE